jgi:hypothetical protein
MARERTEPSLEPSMCEPSRYRREVEGVVVVWQLILAAFLVLLPFALLFDLHPDRERLDGRGRPLRREWH